MMCVKLEDSMNDGMNVWMAGWKRIPVECDTEM